MSPKRITVAEAKRREGETMGRAVKVLDHARLKPNVLVVTFDASHSGKLGMMRQVRCTAYAGQQQMYSAIVSASRERAPSEGVR